MSFLENYDILRQNGKNYKNFYTVAGLTLVKSGEAPGPKKFLILLLLTCAQCTRTDPPWRLTRSIKRITQAKSSSGMSNTRLSSHSTSR